MPDLVPIPSNAFSAGAVKLDNNALDRMLLQNTYAKQQARNFAAQKFLEQSTRAITNQGNGVDANKVDENGNYDPKGRSDLDDFGDAVKDWRNFNIANQRVLSNPNHPNYYNAQSQNEQMYNRAIDIARSSKAKVANLKATADRQKELEAKGMAFTEDALNNLPKAHARVLSENYQPVDLTHPSVTPKPWTQTEDAGFSNELAGIRRTPQKPTITTDEKNGKQIITTENKFDPLSLNQMYIAGSSKYKSHAGFGAMIDGIIKQGGPALQSLKDMFKNEYGQDAQHPEDIAAAYAVSKNKDIPIKQDVRDIPRNSEIGQRNAKSMAATQSTLSTERQEGVFDYKEKNKVTKTKSEGPPIPGYPQKPSGARSPKKLPAEINIPSSGGRPPLDSFIKK